MQSPGIEPRDRTHDLGITSAMILLLCHRKAFSTTGNLCLLLSENLVILVQHTVKEPQRITSILAYVAEVQYYISNIFINFRNLIRIAFQPPGYCLISNTNLNLSTSCNLSINIDDVYEELWRHRKM